MDKRSLRELKIDRELQSLVVPLSRAQYAQLEADVRAGRCREPLLTWRGCILEEYERYEICARHHIEIPVAETAFKCREAVTAWLCAGQLERTGLTEQTRRCLMGIWLEAEKALNREKYGHPKSKETERRIAARAGVAPASVQRYGRYAKALRQMDAVHPGLLSQVLSGKCAQPIQKAVETAKMHIEKRSASVKDMPAYDPDATLTGLALPAPSWAGSIRRVRERADMPAVSPAAKVRLAAALEELQNEIASILSVIEEDPDGLS